MKRGIETKMHRLNTNNNNASNNNFKEINNSDSTNITKVYDFFISEHPGGGGPGNNVLANNVNSVNNTNNSHNQHYYQTNHCNLLLDRCCSNSSDEFYNTPAPSEDIWKKFELLPTPPRSPTHDNVIDELTEDWQSFANAAERLGLFSDLLDVDEHSTGSKSTNDYLDGIINQYGWYKNMMLIHGLKVDLKHDCMWSGQCTDVCKKTKKALANQSLPNLSAADIASILPPEDYNTNSTNNILLDGCIIPSIIDSIGTTPTLNLEASVTPNNNNTLLLANTPNGGVPISPLNSPLSSSVNCGGGVSGSPVATNALYSPLTSLPTTARGPSSVGIISLEGGGSLNDVIGSCVDASCVEETLLPYTPLSDHCYHQAAVVAPPSGRKSGSLGRAAPQQIGGIVGSKLLLDDEDLDIVLVEDEEEEEEEEDDDDDESSVDQCENDVNSTLEDDASNGYSHRHNNKATVVSNSACDLLRRTVVFSDTPSDSDDEIDVVTVSSASIAPSSLNTHNKKNQRVFLNPVIRALPLAESTAFHQLTPDTPQHPIKPRLPRGRPSKASLAAKEQLRLLATQEQHQSSHRSSRGHHHTNSKHHSTTGGKGRLQHPKGVEPGTHFNNNSNYSSSSGNSSPNSPQLPVAALAPPPTHSGGKGRLQHPSNSSQQCNNTSKGGSSNSTKLNGGDLWSTSIITGTTTVKNSTINGSKKRYSEDSSHYSSNSTKGEVFATSHSGNPTRKYRRFKKTSSSSSNSGNHSRFGGSTHSGNNTNHSGNSTTTSLGRESNPSSDSEDCEKRSQHNSMERKRRDDLRFAFQTLRENVPDLQDKPKAPKVMILNKAASYAKQLTNTSAVLERTLKHEAKKRIELQRRLQQLQKY